MGNNKKRKVRVEFRKNREKKARQKDFTRGVLGERLDDNALAASEPVSGKGDLTRYRTVVGTTTDADGNVQIDVDESQCLSGRVLRAVGSNQCTVQAADGTHYQCSVRRVVRTLARDGRNAVVAGDRVLFQPADAEAPTADGLRQGVIERVEPRGGILARGSQRHQHIIVANVTQVLIVASAVDPPLKPSLIDRFLISAEKGGVHPVIGVNKADLADPVELQPIVGLYSRLGYDVVLTSALTGAGIPRLRELLTAEQTVLSGQSGVGKSSLLNAVQEGLGLRTGEVSSDSRKGRHTTRSANLLELDFGGWVVDTPGIRQMELWDVIPEEVEGFFVEFRPFVSRCKFPDCSHTHEQDCGIKSAVALDQISVLRYESYLKIVLGDGD